MKKALLIGIDYIQDNNVTLYGCINDIVNMRNVLIDAYGYNINDITMLRDDETRPEYQPTRANIINNMKNIVAQSANLEELWIHYSGHGSQIKDKNNDEVSGLDDILVPVDYGTQGFIVDDELLSIFKNIKCRSFLLFDSCHSGTVCDFPWNFEYNTPTNLIRKNNNFVIPNPNIYAFSGCKDNQTCSDIYNNTTQQSVGAFTDAFITCLRNNNHNITILNLYISVCKYLMASGYAQVPVLSSSSANPTYTINRALPSGTAQPVAITQKMVKSTIVANMRSVMNA